jgi:hypothetical protein
VSATRPVSCVARVWTRRGSTPGGRHCQLSSRTQPDAGCGIPAGTALAVVLDGVDSVTLEHVLRARVTLESDVISDCLSHGGDAGPGPATVEWAALWHPVSGLDLTCVWRKPIYPAACTSRPFGLDLIGVVTGWLTCGLQGDLYSLPWARTLPEMLTGRSTSGLHCSAFAADFSRARRLDHGSYLYLLMH